MRLSVISEITDMLWGSPMLLLILGTGLFLTLLSGLFPLTHAGSWLRALFPKRRGASASLFTALGGSIGIGSIAGVASALAVGGPGALLWMWVSAFLGMMIKFSEIALSVQYRERTCRGFRGGPMFYMQKALRCRWISVFFCVFTILASFGIGGMCQSNALASSIRYLVGIPPILLAPPLCALYAFFLFGNARVIRTFASIAVPIAAICYLSFGGVLLLLHCRLLPSLFLLILRDAFGAQAVSGGILGVFTSGCVRAGISRGIFSNEAGLGSAPILHAETPHASPYGEGLLGIAEVGISTMLICTVSGLLFLLAQVKCGISFLPRQDTSLLCLQAFSALTSPAGAALFGCAICLFAFMAPLGWSLCGRRAAEFLFPQKPIFSALYLSLFLFSLCLGIFLRVDLVLQFSDLFNALMMLPNLLSLLLLSREIRRILHTKNRKQQNTSDLT